MASCSLSERGLLTSAALTGVQATFRDVLLEDYLHRRVYVGIDYGRLEQDPLLILRLGYQLSKNFALELTGAESIGSYATVELTQLNLLSTPVTDAAVVPYFSLGLGGFVKTPKATLVNVRTVTATIGNAGVGVQYYLTRNFVTRLEYRQFVAPIDENRLDKYRQWSLGIAATWMVMAKQT